MIKTKMAETVTSGISHVHGYGSCRRDRWLIRPPHHQKVHNPGSTVSRLEIVGSGPRFAGYAFGPGGGSMEAFIADQGRGFRPARSRRSGGGVRWRS
jgi:hypothetical protein